jgi:hypothetical protein
MKEPQLFLLKSSDRRSSGTSSAFEVNFTGDYYLQNSWQNVEQVDLEAVMIPNTIYNIR